MRTIADNQCAVISSETGSGKSSQIGLYLLEAGTPRVLVIQPRILAARELMGRARYNLGPANEHLAGYLTGNADDSDCPETARLIYVTEDLLFKMANRGLLRPDDVVINDEAHERTAGTIMLLGLMKELLPQNPHMRLVISSATIPTEKFANYLDAPVLILPGRTHPITRYETTDKVAAITRRHMREQRNVLAFEPGASRLKVTWAKAQSRMPHHTVHMLHGDLSPTDQKLALNPADGNHIIATRVGETSITPENKDVVVDSGLSNLGGYEQGKRVLRTEFSSHATMQQRMGRVGRTKPGIYEIGIPDDAPVPPVYADRPEYDPSVIENSSVAAYVAELLSKGRRLEKLDLLEMPTDENLHYDYILLRRLGATALKDNELVLTDIGHVMTNLPLDSSLARMLVEARKFTDDGQGEALQLQVAAAVAVQQVKGIVDAQQGSLRRYISRKKHQDIFSLEQTSDVLFELDVFTAMRIKHRLLQASGIPDADLQFERYLKNSDIAPNRYYKAVRTFEELCRREELSADDLQKPDRDQRQQIIACQIAGSEELFVQRGKRTHRDIRGESRSLGRRSTIVPHLAHLVVGTAFDMRGLRKTGRYQRRFISAGSVVSTEQLMTALPDRISRLSLGYGVNSKGKFVEKQGLYFDNELRFADIEAELPPTRETRVALLAAMMTGSARSLTNPQQTVAFDPATPKAAEAVRIWKQAQQLEHKSHINLGIARRYNSLINKVIRESLDTDTLPLDVTDPAKLDDLIPRVYVSALVKPSRKRRDLPEIVTKSPDGITIHVSNEEKEYVTVGYKNNIAYITIPRDKKFTMRHSDFDALSQHHEVKIRIGTDKYAQLDTVFSRIDEQRAAEALRQERRAKRRDEMQAAQMRGEEKQERIKRRYDEEQRKLEANRRVDTKPAKRRGANRSKRRLRAGENE